MTTAAIGVIGGSGLYAMEGVTGIETLTVHTPFGAPSDAIRLGAIEGVPVAFLPRHGAGHRVAPHEINYRANIWALKSVGVRWLVSVTAVGSMKEAIRPGELVLVEANSKSYKELARADLLDGKCWSTPALAGGKVYIRSTAEGGCFDLSAGGVADANR